MTNLKWTAFGSMGVLAILLAGISFAVSSGASSSLYTSWFMIALWGVCALSSMAYIVKVHLLRERPKAAIHISLLVILMGALGTHCFGKEGVIALQKGQADASLPFSVKLLDVNIETYPGTGTPLSYSAKLQFKEGSGQSELTSELNKPCSFRGYRFLMQSIDGSDKVKLSWSYDPVGLPLTYIGYALFFFSCIFYFFGRHTAWRMALKRLALPGLLLLPSGAQAAPQTVSASFANRIGRTPVYYEGAIVPFTEMAADFTRMLTGSCRVDSLSAERVTCGYIFHFDDWKDADIIKVDTKGLRGKLGATASYAALFQNQNLLNDKDRARFELVNALVSGGLLKMFPVPVNNGIVWLSPDADVPVSLSDEQWMFVRKAFGLVSEQVLQRRYGDAAQVLDKIEKYQRQKVKEGIPSPSKLRLICFYIRHLRDLRWPVYLLLGLGLALTIVSLGRTHTNRFVVTAGRGLALVNFLYASVLLALRWIVTGSVPLGNGYETMLFMAWLVSAVGVASIWGKGAWIYLLYATLVMSPMCLMVSAFSGGGSALKPLMPVLNSAWLSVHVVAVMMSYTLFALMAVMSAVALLSRSEKASDRISDVNRLLIYPAEFLLGAGIFIGAVWANQSWGRYWGWDPKEVWALITFMVYAFGLHRMVKRLNLFCLLAFITVLVTYFGVNFLLGGLHSYA